MCSSTTPYQTYGLGLALVRRFSREARLLATVECTNISVRFLLYGSPNRFLVTAVCTNLYVRTYIQLVARFGMGFEPLLIYTRCVRAAVDKWYHQFGVLVVGAGT